MAVNVKMGVDLSSFNSGIREGQGILKGLNAEMKATEAEFKATGNAEKALADKTKTLNSQLNVQRGIATQAQQALKAMEEAGIKPTDQAYQKLYATMMNAQAGMNEAQAALNALSGGEKQAAQEANNLSSSVQGISKKMSLQQVIDGVDRITSGLEKAAKKAIDLGTELWNAVMDSAKRADDTETMAKMYGIDLDTFMKMQKLVAGGMDTSVETMLSAQDKLKRGIGKDNKEVMGYLEELGLTFKTVKGDVAMLVTDDTEEMFWRVGKAIMEMGDAYDQEAAASALFGKSWKELKPLFETYEDFEAYKKARDAQVVNDEQTIRNLAELNDAVSKLESSWTTLKDELLGAIAPGLEIAADSLSTLLDSVTTYLKSDEGQEMLQKLGDAISGLFGYLSKIDPDKVVSGFVEVFTKVTGGIEWLVENEDAAKGILAAIVTAWGTITIGGTVMKIINFVNGVMGLAGGAGSAATAGAAAGSSWAGAFASAAMKATPFLAFLYTLLNPELHPNADDDVDILFDKDGNLTKAGIEKGITEEQAKAAAEAGKEYRENNQAVKDATGLTEEQITTMQKFWHVWKDVQDIWKEGKEVPEHRMDVYNEYGQRLQEIFGDNDKQRVAYMKKMQELYESGYRGEMLGWNFFDIGQDGKRVGTVEIEGVVHFVDENGNNIGADLGKGETVIHKDRRPRKKEEPVEVPAELEAETTPAELAAQVGTVEIPVTFTWGGLADVMARLAAAIAGTPGHANGLPFVPYDNYLARLHKGERVLTANQNRHYTFNSNNYFGNVNLNNGQDIEALCNSIDRHNRRQRSGYGS